MVLVNCVTYTQNHIWGFPSVPLSTGSGFPTIQFSAAVKMMLQGQGSSVVQGSLSTRQGVEVRVEKKQK